MLFRSSFRFLLFCATPLAFSFSPACSTPAATDTCTDGNEGCPCFTNGTCNGALRCLSNLCVTDDSQTSGGAGASSTGTPTGASGSMTNGGSTSTGSTPSGGTAMGGSTNTGGTPGAAGMPGGATGGMSSAGNTSTGGSSATAGSTSGGGADCGDTTSDPENCGSCGHKCRETYTGACADGTCQPSYTGCFLEDEFENCTGFCLSVGETCVERGCGSKTWRLWSSDAETCVANSQVVNDGGDTCDQSPLWLPGTNRARCCCTDTQ